MSYWGPTTAWTASTCGIIVITHRAADTAATTGPWIGCDYIEHDHQPSFPEFDRLREYIRDLRVRMVRLLHGYRPAVPPYPYRAPRPSVALNAGMHWRRMRRSCGLARART